MTTILVCLTRKSQSGSWLPGFSRYCMIQFERCPPCFSSSDLGVFYFCSWSMPLRLPNLMSKVPAQKWGYEWKLEIRSYQQQLDYFKYRKFIIKGNDVLFTCMCINSDEQYNSCINYPLNHSIETLWALPHKNRSSSGITGHNHKRAHQRCAKIVVQSLKLTKMWNYFIL